MANKNRASLVVIFFTIFIDLMGFGILIPILPTFASRQLGIGNFGIGAIAAVYSLMQFVFNPIIGKYSDRIGRRPVILTTQLLTALSYVIFSFSNSFALLFFSRMLGGLGGSNIGVAQAYIADITSREDRAKGMGVIGAAFGLGFVFGPLIGALLSKYGYHIVGLASAGFTLSAFIFAFFRLPESIKEKKLDRKIEFKLFDVQLAKKIISHPTIGFIIILYFFIIFAIANIYGTFAIFGYKYFHFTDPQNGELLGITGAVGALIQVVIIKRLAQRMNDRTIVLIGITFMVAGLALIPYGRDFAGEAIVISVLAVGTGILQPIIPSVISKHSPQDQQGEILGFSQSVSAFARALGPLWGGLAFDLIGYQFAFLSGAFITLIMFVVSYFMLDPVKLSVSYDV